MKNNTLYAIVALLVIISFLFGFAVGALATANAMVDAIVTFVDTSEVNITIDLDEEKMVDYTIAKAEAMQKFGVEDE